jgi:hypothetical protein
VADNAGLLIAITRLAAFSSMLSKSLAEGKHATAVEGVPRAAEGPVRPQAGGAGCRTRGGPLHPQPAMPGCAGRGWDHQGAGDGVGDGPVEHICREGEALQPLRQRADGVR